MLKRIIAATGLLLALGLVGCGESADDELPPLMREAPGPGGDDGQPTQ